MSIKLSKATIRKACARHNWVLQWCWNYEKMQAAGYTYAMVPVFKELYSDTETICRNLERHMNFYNTHPTASALIFGADVALEEAGQIEIGDSLKIGLMGPLAGIGDTIQGVLLTPPINLIAASLAAEGKWISIIIASIPLTLLFVLRWPLFRYGYKQGANIVNDVSGVGKLENFQIASSILGATVMGGFVPSMLHITLPVKLGKDLLNDAGKVIQSAKTLQEALDAIFPYTVPLIITGACYYAVKVKKVKPLVAILLVFIVGFVLGALGIMA